MAKKKIVTDNLRESMLDSLQEMPLKRVGKGSARQKRIKKDEDRMAPAVPFINPVKADLRLPGRKGWPQEWTCFSIEEWVKKHISDFPDIDKQAVKESLATRLKEQRFDMVIPGYLYRGFKMDLYAIAAGRAVEYEIITTAQGLADELFRAAQFGKEARNWHVALFNGLLPQNMFYFVVPTGFVDPKLLPSHCGVIEFEYSPKWGRIVFTAVRPSQLYHREYVSNYKTIAMYLYEKSSKV